MIQKLKLLKNQEEPEFDRTLVKPPKRQEDESNWLISYADMMTLLCAFFVMMFSLSTVDKPKYERIKGELARHFGGDYKSQNEDLAKFATQTLQEIGMERDAVVKSDPTGVTIVFHSTVMFKSSDAQMSTEGKQVLTKLIQMISERQEAEQKKYKILIEGHTDSKPIVSGDYSSNWELSSDRAMKVLRQFVDSGFDPLQLIAVGYADTRPTRAPRTDTGEWDESALAENRRVVVRIMEPNVQTVPWSPTEFNEF